MIYKRLSPMPQQNLIHFLQSELAISAHAISIGLRHSEQTPSLLPMVLWQYGLITLEQLDQVFEWMATDTTPDHGGHIHQAAPQHLFESSKSRFDPPLNHDPRTAILHQTP